MRAVYGAGGPGCGARRRSGCAVEGGAGEDGGDGHPIQRVAQLERLGALGVADPVTTVAERGQRLPALAKLDRAAIEVDRHPRAPRVVRDVADADRLLIA